MSIVLSRLKNESNGAKVAKIVEDGLEAALIHERDLETWDRFPEWIYSAPLPISDSLRRYAYGLLMNDEYELVKHHLTTLLDTGLPIHRLVQIIREYKELHDVTSKVVVQWAMENPYILGHVMKPSELHHLDRARPKTSGMTTLTRIRAYLAAEWRDGWPYRTSLTPDPKKKDTAIRHAAQKLALDDSDHDSAWYETVIRQRFLELVPRLPQTGRVNGLAYEWPWKMEVWIAEDGKTALWATPSWLKWQEHQAIGALKRRLSLPQLPLPEGWHEFVRGLELGDPDQEAALTRLWQQPISFVVGRPGTGKTRLAKALQQAIDVFGGTALGCAPTGIAAKRLETVSGIPSMTIHRRYGLHQETADHLHKESLLFPHRHRDRFLVCDEAGMLNLSTFHAVMWGTPLEEGVRVILMGDDRQLPPIGYAEPFANLLSQPQFDRYVIRLHTLHRTKNDLAIAVERYFDAKLPLPWGTQLLAHVVSSEDLSSLQQEIKRWIDEHTGSDWQILTPFRKEHEHNGFGANEINAWIWLQEDPLGEGRKMVQTKNNYDTNLFNGDVGKIVSVNKGEHTALFDTHAVTLPDDIAYEEWMAADCLTIHKAQGGEYDHTLVVLPTGVPFIDPRALYTAMSRSRSTVTVLAVAPYQAVDTIRKATPRHQKTKFWHKLHEIIVPESVSIRSSDMMPTWKKKRDKAAQSK